MDEDPDPILAEALPSARLKLARVCHERALECLVHVTDPSLEKQNALPLLGDQREIVHMASAIACMRIASVMAEFVQAGGDISEFVGITDKNAKFILTKFYDIYRQVHPEKFA